jgi:hypothetical protein
MGLFICRSEVWALIPPCPFFSGCLLLQIFYGHTVKPLLFPVVLALLFIPLILLSGCAAAEQDAEGVESTAVQGLTGKGHLYTEKVMKDDLGNDFR